MECKSCGSTHDGSFGSGKYCGRSCSNRRVLSEETKLKIAKSMPPGEKLKKACLQCSTIFEMSIKKRHTKFCCRSCSAKHTGKTENLSAETRQKLSVNAKTRHAKGDGNIGFRSRKKFQSSFPEKLTEEFFSKRGIKFDREVRLGKWFADFLFVGKIVLEIDGQQHQKPERKAKDEEKDIFLTSQGYRVVRVPFNGPNESFFEGLNKFHASVAQW